jgi:hypothetical protein
MHATSTRRLLALVAMVVGALLLLLMPAALLYFAVTDAQDAHLPGTLVIVSATGGMALLALGALIRE